VKLNRLWYGSSPIWERWVAGVTLAPISMLYGSAIAVRNTLFDVGVLESKHVEAVQVVSVGNIVVGGAGKTPLVIWLAQWALNTGRKVAVLSRGYGRKSKKSHNFDARALPAVEEVGDEPRLIARRAPGARVWVDGDRFHSAKAAAAAGYQVLLLDDGFQHRRLARDVDVLIEVPEAKPRLLPWGPLREPLSARQRATVVWNGKGASDPSGGIGVRQIVDVHHTAVDWPKRAFLMTGIARPERFEQTVQEKHVEIVGRRHFSDHHRFRTSELAKVMRSARKLDAAILTTEKDRERLPDDFEVLTVQTELVVSRGAETMARALGWPLAAVPVSRRGGHAA
jgi:tetraacyldisaccharide 4'-kinase